MICNNIGVNEKGHLTFAGRDTVELAKKYATPLYLMDEEKIREKCRIYIKAMKESFGGDSHPLYASKACCFKRIYEIMKEEGMGIDIVSSGELYTAYKAGFDLGKAFFHGNNKTDRDICFAMDCGMGYFVCDNMDELDAINEEAGKRGFKQKILLRLTPGIDPHTQAKISTGKIDSKFGIGIETGQAIVAVEETLKKENIELCGYHCHIGSQTFEYEPFADAAKIMLGFSGEVKNKFGFEAPILNLGGGMGVPYIESHPVIDYAKNIAGIGALIKDICNELGLSMPTVLMEPGRSIVADAGMTLYTVGGTKEIPGFKNYTAIDGGMPDNPRYTLYESPYTVELANKMNAEKDFTCTIAGRCCESGDLIQEGVTIPKPVRGDIVAVCTTGAYNYSMASNYNRIPRPPVVMLTKEGEYTAVRRETFDDLMSNDL